METTQEEFEKEMMKEWRIMDALQSRKEKHIKDSFKAKLKDLINTDSLYEHLDEHSWMPEEIVEIKLTDDKRNGYGNTQCARISSHPDRLIYLKTTEDEVEGIDHYYVCQQCHYEDSYSGYMLFPLSDGRFFKVSYSC